MPPRRAKDPPSVPASVTPARGIELLERQIGGANALLETAWISAEDLQPWSTTTRAVLTKCFGDASPNLNGLFSAMGLSVVMNQSDAYYERKRRESLGGALKHLGSCIEQLQIDLEDEGSADVPVAGTGMSDSILAVGTHIGFLREGNLSVRHVVRRALGALAAALAGRHHKTSLLLCGSLAEALLVDVLGRRPDLATSHLGKHRQFPDDASLGDLIGMACVEPDVTTPLLQATTASLAQAVREHRDLIHPSREVASRIVVDEATAHAMVSLLRLVARDLDVADREKTIEAYTQK